MRSTGSYITTTTLSESVQAFVPHALPPRRPVLALESFVEPNRVAELALARLSGVSGLVPSVDWLLYSAIRKEALLTSQIEGTQATLIDLFDSEAGLVVSNTDDVEEVTNYLRAFKLVQGNLRDPAGLPISVRLLCDAHRLDRRVSSRQGRFCAATARARRAVVGRHGEVHSCGYGFAAAGQDRIGACSV
jgi:Fic family protein